MKAFFGALLILSAAFGVQAGAPPEAQPGVDPVEQAAMNENPSAAMRTTPSHVRSGEMRTFAACRTVYPTFRAAAMRCPIDAEPIRVYDFWNGQLRGWSCDCAAEDFTYPEL